MENLPKTKKRGRPRKLPEPTHGGLPQIPKDIRALVGFDVPTERTSANRVYADKARGVLPELSKSLSVPYDPAWQLRFVSE